MTHYDEQRKELNKENKTKNTAEKILGIIAGICLFSLAVFSGVMI